MNKIDLKKVEEVENKVRDLCGIGSIKFNHKNVAALIGLMVKKAMKMQTQLVKIQVTIFNTILSISANMLKVE